MIPGLIFLIVIFSLVLIKSADLVIVGLRRISRQTNTGTFALSAVLLAIGTSFPELFVGITSAIEKEPNLSLGVVLGSNIANIALVGGLSAFFVGRVRVYGDYIKRDFWIAVAAGILPVLLVIFDKSLNRVDGLILLMVYLAYATGFFRRRYEQIGKEQQEEESFVYRFLRRFNHIDRNETKEFGRLFVGIALLLFSADAIVNFSSILATQAKLPIFVIGLVVLAIGTSLPEFAFSLRSLEDHEPSMFFGNLLGSTIANSTLILGVASLISPIKIVAFNEYFAAAITFVLVFLLFYMFIRSKHRLDRWEAAVLLVLYFTFLIVEFT
jgi:cation:H+ antiporter